jgi:putative intracellular protease/amidase
LIPTRKEPTVQTAILLYPDMTALDAIGPYDVLSNVPDMEVVLVGRDKGEYRTEHGTLGLVADAAFGDVTRADVLVVPGGFGTRRLMKDEEYLDWIRGVHVHTTWTTSVCTGSLLLGAAGLLDGLDATTHWASYGLLESTGARATEERVVERGKIITAAGVSSGIDMALRLVAHLAGDEVAMAIQLGIEYDPQPPFDTGSPSKAPAEIVELVRALNDSRQDTFT